MIRRTFEYLSWFGNDRPFFTFLRVEPKTPWRSQTHTWEASGKRWAPTTVVRLLGRWAVAWGSWQDVQPESIVKVRDADIAFAGFVAVNGPGVDREKWEEAWVQVKDLGLDPDDEMALLHEMGVTG